MTSVPAPCEEFDRIRIVLTQAIVSLCNAGLSFSSELTVEGLIGITLDRKNVVLVNIKEIVQGAKGAFLAKYSQWPSMAPKISSIMKQSEKISSNKPHKRKSIPKKVPQSKSKRGRPIKKVTKSNLDDDIEDIDDDDDLKCELADIQDSDYDESIEPLTTKGNSSQDASIEIVEAEKRTGLKPRAAKRRARSCMQDALMLPDPEQNPEKSDLIRFVNQAVTDAMAERTEKRKRRGEYNVYSPEMRARIGQHAVEFGISSACRYFTQESGKPISESTVRAMRKQYRRAKEETGGMVTELPQGTRGRKSLLQKYYDDEIMEYVENLKQTGSAVNPQIVLDAAKGILLHHDRLLLKEFGGPIELTRGWAEAFLKRMEKRDQDGGDSGEGREDGVIASSSECSISLAQTANHNNMTDSIDAHATGTQGCVRTTLTDSASLGLLPPNLQSNPLPQVIQTDLLHDVAQHAISENEQFHQRNHQVSTSHSQSHLGQQGHGGIS